jgi:hypothetical protein
MEKISEKAEASTNRKGYDYFKISIRADCGWLE